MGSGELWITELVLMYDGKPFYTVSIMEIRGVKVARETQYFAAPFEAGGRQYGQPQGSKKSGRPSRGEG